ncbi:hypothetical protein GS506_12850 [Rhodococcus hoagii]|nr:hypothetical protein [Prescottella equi]
MTRQPVVAIIGDRITIRAGDSRITVSRDDWDLITNMVNQHAPLRAVSDGCSGTL